MRPFSIHCMEYHFFFSPEITKMKKKKTPNNRCCNNMWFHFGGNIGHSGCGRKYHCSIRFYHIETRDQSRECCVFAFSLTHAISMKSKQMKWTMKVKYMRTYHWNSTYFHVNVDDFRSQCVCVCLCVGFWSTLLYTLYSHSNCVMHSFLLLCIFDAVSSPVSLFRLLSPCSSYWPSLFRFSQLSDRNRSNFRTLRQIFFGVFFFPVPSEPCPLKETSNALNAFRLFRAVSFIVSGVVQFICDFQRNVFIEFFSGFILYAPLMALRIFCFDMC